MKKRVRKAQVSVFVIFALILTITGLTAYFISSKNQKNVDEYFSSPELKPQMDNIKDSISDCIEYTCIDGLDLIGVQGGYYIPPKESYDAGFTFLPYYYKQGSFLMPDVFEIERELENYVNKNLANCFKDINEEGFILDYKEPITKTTIVKGVVNFNVDMKVSISKDSRSIIYELKDNPYKKDSKLYEILEVAKYITDSHKEDPNMICMNCIADMAEERGIFVEMADFAHNSTLVVLSEKTTSDYPYYFEFLNKY